MFYAHSFNCCTGVRLVGSSDKSNKHHLFDRRLKAYMLTNNAYMESKADIYSGTGTGGKTDEKTA